MLLFFMFLDYFTLKKNSSCSESNIYLRFIQVNDAGMACNSDSECIGIYDESCDQKGSYRLCKKGFQTLFKDPSCVYKKDKYFGKYIS